MPETVLLFRKFLRSAASAEDHANLALLFHRHRRRIEAGIVDCLRRSRYCQRHDAGHMFPLARIHPGELIKVWNFASDVHRQIGRIKA